MWLRNTFGVSNGFVPGTFLPKAALPYPPLIRIFVTICSWFIGDVLFSNWEYFNL